MVGDGDLALHVAFSRQNPDPRGGRVYVQRRIREQGKTLSRLIVDLGANVLVSGSAKQMPLDVREAFRDVLATSEKVRACVMIQGPVHVHFCVGAGTRSGMQAEQHV